MPIGSPFIELAAVAPRIVAPFIANVTWPQLLAVLSAPVCFAKQVINVVQLWKASKILVGVDLAQRQAARLEASMKED